MQIKGSVSFVPPHTASAAAIVLFRRSDIYGVSCAGSEKDLVLRRQVLMLLSTL